MERLGESDLDNIFDDVLADASVGSNVLLEDSYSSICEPDEDFRPPAESTPKRRPQRQKQPCTSQGASATRKLSCTQCKNQYANERTLGVHIKMHAMKRASFYLPGKEQMKELTHEAILKAFEEIQNEKHQSESGMKLGEYCTDVQKCIDKGEGEGFSLFLSECFHKILAQQNVLLPSTLSSSVYKNTNKHLNSLEFRQKIKDILLSMKTSSDEVLNLFIGCVCWKVFRWQLVFSLRVVRGNPYQVEEVRKRYSSDSLHPEEFQQLVYHIGGFILHGIVRKSKLYASNPDWAVYGEVIKLKFLSQSLFLESECPAHVKCFSEGRDRGGLTFCNQESYCFFLQLFELLMSLEGRDGSLPIELAQDSVLDNDILIFMWDDLAGVELTEEQSIYLLTDIVRCCAKVLSRGILERKLNEQLEKAYSSVPLRQRVAR